MAPRRDKGEERVIAEERMLALGELAAAAAGDGADALASRYVDLARRIGMRHQLALPTQMRRRLCRTCGAYLVPGRNARVRLRKGRSVTACLLCSRVQRVGLAVSRVREAPRGRGGAPRGPARRAR